MHNGNSYTRAPYLLQRFLLDFNRQSDISFSVDWTNTVDYEAVLCILGIQQV